MTKVEFLSVLQERLAGLPEQDLQERLSFYREMIEDRMEEGLSEEDAVLAVGSAEEIASQVIGETPLAKIAKERIKPNRRMRLWELLLLTLGSPVWLSLGIALFAVVLSLYLSLWAVVLSLWAVFVSLIVCAVAGVIGGILLACFRRLPAGLFMVGAGLVLGGLGIFLFFGCKASTKGTVLLVKNLVLWLKNKMMKKEDA